MTMPFTGAENILLEGDEVDPREVDEPEAEEDDDDNDDENEESRHKSKTTRKKSKNLKMDPEILDVINAETRGIGCRRQPFLRKFDNSKSSKCHLHAINTF